MILRNAIFINERFGKLGNIVLKTDGNTATINEYSNGTFKL